MGGWGGGMESQILVQMLGHFNLFFIFYTADTDRLTTLSHLKKPKNSLTTQGSNSKHITQKKRTECTRRQVAFLFPQEQM